MPASSQILSCPSCGKKFSTRGFNKNNANSTFCKGCGQELIPTKVQKTQTQTQTQLPSEDQSETTKTQKRAKTLNKIRTVSNTSKGLKKTPGKRASSSQKINSKNHSYHKLNSFEELNTVQQEDLNFALRLLKYQRIDPVSLTNALEEIKKIRSEGEAINFGQYLMRRRLLEVADFVQVMKDVSTMGGEKILIPEGYEIYLDEERILIQDKKMPTKVGDYQILQELGRGGMGIVYRVYHEGLSKEFALKMLLLGERSSEDMIKRFFNEAKAIAKLSHPNIIPVHYVGTDQKGNPYFTMEFIEGRSLDELIREQKIPVRRAVKIIHDLADALTYTHREGIIHRDIKPQNILMRNDKDPVLTDFGLAKDAADESSMTQTGTALGTPAYMSPEQASGNFRKVGPSSDVYSLGAVMYEMIANRPPFQAENQIQMLQKVCNNDVVNPRLFNDLIPKDIENICLKSMEKDKRKRYSSAEDFRKDLDSYLRGEPVKARPITPLNRLFRKAKKYKKITLTLFLTLTLIFGSTYFYYTLPGNLKIQTSPKEAKVFVDGILFETNQTIQNLSSGVHQIRIEKEGYEPLESKVLVGRGTTSGYQFNLYSIYGNLLLFSQPSGCQVEIYSSDQKELLQKIETTPAIAELKEGSYFLRFYREGYHLREGTVTVKGGHQNTSIELALKPNNAHLTIVCRPENEGSTLQIKSLTYTKDEVLRLSLPLLQPLALKAGRYELLFHQTNYIDHKLYLEAKPNESIQLHLHLEPRLLLEYKFPDSLVASPNALDINEDGFPELFVPCEDHILYALEGKTRQLLWKWKTGGTIFAKPVLYSPNPKKHVIYCSSQDGYLYALNATNGKLIWKKHVGFLTTGIVLEKIKGIMALFCCNEKAKIYRLDPRSGDEKWSFQAKGPTSNNEIPVLGNVLGDAKKELVMSIDRDAIYILAPSTGKKLAQYQPKESPPDGEVCLFDFDKDQYLDLLFSLKNSSSQIYSPHKKSILARLPTKGIHTVQDLNGDGTPFICQPSSNGNLYLYKGDKPYNKIHAIQIKQPMPTPAIFEDIDRDGVLDIIFESGEDVTYIYSGKDYSLLYKFATTIKDWGKYSLQETRNTKGPMMFRFNTGITSPFLTDLNQDGSLDLLVASENGKLYGFTPKDREILTSIPLGYETKRIKYVPTKEGGILFLQATESNLFGFSCRDGRLLFKLKDVEHFRVEKTTSKKLPQQVLIRKKNNKIHLYSLPDFKKEKEFIEQVEKTPFLVDLNKDSSPERLILYKTQLLAKEGKSGKPLFRVNLSNDVDEKFLALWEEKNNLREFFVRDLRGTVYAISPLNGSIRKTFLSFSGNSVYHTLTAFDKHEYPELIGVKPPFNFKIMDGKTGSTRLQGMTQIPNTTLTPIFFRNKKGNIVSYLPSWNQETFSFPLNDFDGDKISDIATIVDYNKINIFSTKEQKLLHNFSTKKTISSPLRMADFDGDKIPDILVGCMEQLCIYSGVTGKIIWQINFTARIELISEIHDMNQDQVLDFWVITRNQHCYQISPILRKK